MDEELNKLIDSLPPYPKGFMPWTEEDEKRFKYEPSEDNYQNLRNKVYKLWVLWADLRTSKLLTEILNNPPEEKETDEYKVKAIVANVIDKMAKILTQGDLLQELFLEKK